MLENDTASYYIVGMNDRRQISRFEPFVYQRILLLALIFELSCLTFVHLDGKSVHVVFLVPSGYKVYVVFPREGKGGHISVAMASAIFPYCERVDWTRYRKLAELIYHVESDEERDVRFNYINPELDERVRSRRHLHEHLPEMVS